MKFLTTREMAAKWGVSVQLIRKYTGDGRIPGAILKDGGWLIPEDAEKPGLPPREEVEITPFLKKLRYQQERNNHHPVRYNTLILSGQLWDLLAQVNEQTQDRLDRTIAQMAASESVTEDLKAADPMAWVGAMNNIRSRAEEVVLQDLIWEEEA